jgi:uncharacterized membrane protein YjfL (UPF0719 family)
MQYFTLIGGFIGFVLTFAVSLFSGKNLSDSVFNATVGCLLIALLFRGFHLVIERCAAQIVAEKTRQRDLARAAEEQQHAASPAAEPGSQQPGTTQPAA